MMEVPWIAPPREAMGPISRRSRAEREVRREAGGVAGRVEEEEEEEEEEVGVMKANGKWPLSASGMLTTQASEMEGCERRACSSAPVEVGEVLV